MAVNKRAPSEVPHRGPADPALGGVSLVFPVHNESFIIEQTLRNYIAELAGRVPELEVIVAEDGSTDDTKVVLERLEEELPINLFMNDERKGYQQAVRDAISHATKPWLFIVDSDYQFAAIDFWRLEPHRKTHDVILGMKRPRKDPFYREPWGLYVTWGLLLAMDFYAYRRRPRRRLMSVAAILAIGGVTVAIGVPMQSGVKWIPLLRCLLASFVICLLAFSI